MRSPRLRSRMHPTRRLTKHSTISPAHPTESPPSRSRCAPDPPHNLRNAWPSATEQRRDRREGRSLTTGDQVLLRLSRKKLNFRTGTRYGRSSPESCSTTGAALDHHADDGSVLTPWSDRHDRWTGITPDHRRSRCEYDASNRHDGRRFKLHQKLQRPCRKQPLSTEITYLVGHCGRGLI